MVPHLIFVYYLLQNKSNNNLHIKRMNSLVTLHFTIMKNIYNNKIHKCHRHTESSRSNLLITHTPHQSVSCWEKVSFKCWFTGRLTGENLISSGRHLTGSVDAFTVYCHSALGCVTVHWQQQKHWGYIKTLLCNAVMQGTNCKVVSSLQVAKQYPPSQNGNKTYETRMTASILK